MGTLSIPAPAPAAAPRPAFTVPQDAAKLRKAAQDFEAMAIGQLLQPMFDTVDTAHTVFGGGSAEAAWKPMMIEEMAKNIAAHGGLGLAAPIHAALLRMREAKS